MQTGLAGLGLAASYITIVHLHLVSEASVRRPHPPICDENALIEADAICYVGHATIGVGDVHFS